MVLLAFARRLYLGQDRSNGFVPFVLVRRDSVSPTASIFYLEPKYASKSLGEYQNAWKKGVWNFQFKQSQIQVVRAYTPLPPVLLGGVDAAEVESRLRFLIRNEKHGEVSGWLHRLPVGSEIELRGPNIEYEISPETKQVIFLAGGTGIVSALQAAHAVLSRPADGTAKPQDHKDPPRVSILWANRTRDDCLGAVSNTLTRPAPVGIARWLPRSSVAPDRQPLTTSDKNMVVSELEALQATHPGRVSVDYFVDADDVFIDKSALTRMLDMLEETGHGSATNAEIIISGPEGFINYLAGPKVWRNGNEEQGPVNGVVAQALQSIPDPPKVWKV